MLNFVTCVVVVVFTCTLIEGTQAERSGADSDLGTNVNLDKRDTAVVDPHLQHISTGTESDADIVLHRSSRLLGCLIVCAYLVGVAAGGTYAYKKGKEIIEKHKKRIQDASRQKRDTDDECDNKCNHAEAVGDPKIICVNALGSNTFQGQDSSEFILAKIDRVDNPCDFEMLVKEADPPAAHPNHHFISGTLFTSRSGLSIEFDAADFSTIKVNSNSVALTEEPVLTDVYGASFSDNEVVVVIFDCEVTLRGYYKPSGVAGVSVTYATDPSVPVSSQGKCTV